jgi:hypothetical protein
METDSTTQTKNVDTRKKKNVYRLKIGYFIYRQPHKVM